MQEIFSFKNFLNFFVGREKYKRTNISFSNKKEEEETQGNVEVFCTKKKLFIFGVKIFNKFLIKKFFLKHKEYQR